MQERRSLGYRNVDLYVNINILGFGKYCICSTQLVKKIKNKEAFPIDLLVPTYRAPVPGSMPGRGYLICRGLVLHNGGGVALVLTLVVERLSSWKYIFGSSCTVSPQYRYTVHTASNLSAAQMIHGGGWIGEGEGYGGKGYDRVCEQTLNRTAYYLYVPAQCRI